MYLYMYCFLGTKSVALRKRATSARQKKRDAARTGTPLDIKFHFCPLRSLIFASTSGHLSANPLSFLCNSLHHSYRLFSSFKERFGSLP